MMKKTTLAAAILACTFATGQAAADTGIYVFGSTSMAYANLDKLRNDLRAETGERVSKDRADHAYKLGAGYRLTEMLAVELQYASLGKFSATSANTTVRLDPEAYGANLVATWPMTNDFSLHGKVGVHRVKTDWRVSDANGADSGSNRRNSPSVSVGGTLNVTQGIDLVVDYDHFYRVNRGSRAKIDLYSVGFRYTF